MSRQYSAVRADTIEYAFWLTFDPHGGVRLSRGEPTIARAERSVSLTAKLPKSLFSTPVIRANLTIAPEVCQPPELDIEALGNAIRSLVGSDINVDLAISTTGIPND